MARYLTDKGVAALKPRAARYAHPDPELRGHYVRVQPSGSKSFVVVAKPRSGKQVWVTIGPTDAMGIEEARTRAREVLGRIRFGLGQGESYQTVSELYLRRHGEAKGVRTIQEIRRCLGKYIFPSWADREFCSLRRSDVSILLDKIEDHHGARQADCCLTIMRAIANWYAARNDDYHSPVTRGMRRSTPTPRARILDDDELRAIWQGAEGAFGDFVRLALLTGQRREKLASMRWEDISVDGEWRISAAAREKGTGGTLLLPPVAVEVIKRQPRYASNPYVFAGRGDRHFNNFSASKRALDEKIPLPDWSIHDLRRTSRSLMSRAGVPSDIAERVLGHAIEGIKGVYDRHSYRDEKADALKLLAAVIERIIDPPGENVTALSAGGAR